MPAVVAAAGTRKRTHVPRPPPPLSPCTLLPCRYPPLNILHALSLCYTISIYYTPSHYATPSQYTTRPLNTDTIFQPTYILSPHNHHRRPPFSCTPLTIYLLPYPYSHILTPMHPTCLIYPTLIYPLSYTHSHIPTITHPTCLPQLRGSSLGLEFGTLNFGLLMSEGLKTRLALTPFTRMVVIFRWNSLQHTIHNTPYQHILSMYPFKHPSPINIL